MAMKTFRNGALPTLSRIAAFLVAAICGAACGGSTGPTLRVNTPPTGHLGAYKSVQIFCTAEDEKEKGKEYTGRFESLIMVKLKERDAFQEYHLSMDQAQPDITLKVVILDMKKAGGWGWYGRSSSKVSCDATLADAKTGATVAGISVVAKPKYSSVETAMDDAAVQIADWIRENK
jgi:hypothetical protein